MKPKDMRVGRNIRSLKVAKLHRIWHRSKIKNPCKLLKFSHLQGLKIAGAGLYG